MCCPVHGRRSGAGQPVGAEDFQRSYLAPIFREIRELSLCFTDFNLVYANRSCNRVAHMLAKQVTDDIRLGEWHSAPTCIDLLLTEDCNPVNE